MKKQGSLHVRTCLPPLESLLLKPLFTQPLWDLSLDCRQGLVFVAFPTEPPVCPFGVLLVEEVKRTLGHTLDPSLRDTLDALQNRFSLDKGMLEMARCFACVELSPSMTSTPEMQSQKKSLALKHHPDKGAIQSAVTR